MPISQQVSPATIGDQLLIGGTVVHNASGTSVVLGVTAGDVALLPTPATFVTREPPVEFLLVSGDCPGLTLQNSYGAKVSFVYIEAGSQFYSGQHHVYNYNSLVSFGGVISQDVGANYVSPRLYSNESAAICSGGFSALPHFLGLTIDTGIVSWSGISTTEYGDLASILSQLLTDVTAFDQSLISKPDYISFGKLDSNLGLSLCGSHTLTLGGPYSEQRAVNNFEHTSTAYGASLVQNYNTIVRPAGEILSEVNESLFVDFDDLYLRLSLYSVECSGGTVQSSMGLNKGAMASGVPSLEIGVWGYNQGPPKVFLSANDQLTVGVWGYSQPTPTNFHAPTIPTGSIGQHKVYNQHVFVHFPGLTDTQITGSVLSRRDPPQPLGEDHSEFGTLFISHWRRFPGPATVGETLDIPDYHWVSSSPRYITPDSDVLGGVGQGLVEERIFSAGDLLDYGIAFVYNLNKFAGPMGIGTVSEHTNGATIYFGTRYLSDFQILSYDFGLTEVINNNSVVSPYTGLLDTFMDGAPFVHNAEVPVFPVPYEATVIPFTHLIHRNPYQQLHQGQDYSRVGAMYVELGIRRVYPGVVSNTEVFNPGMRVTREIVIAPVGNQFDAYGVWDTYLLDLPYAMSSYEGFEPGVADVGYLNRHKQMHGENFLEIPQPSVRNAAEFVAPVGQEHFVQPYQTTYIVEHFSIIGPTIIPSTKYGATYVHNLNQEPLIGGGDLSQVTFGHKVELFTRTIQLVGLGTEFGDAYVHDARQGILFQNPTNYSYYGNLTIYLGQPWLPTNQSVYAPSIARVASPGLGDSSDSFWIGGLDMATNPRYMAAYGEVHTRLEVPEVAYSGVNFSLQQLYTLISTPTILAATPQTVSLVGEAKDHSRVGNATFRPNWVYMTAPPVPNPYPNTHGWYAPDSSIFNPPYRRYKIGRFLIENFNREFSIGGTDYSYISVGTQVGFPESAPAIVPRGVQTSFIPMFGLLGGVRTVMFGDNPSLGPMTTNIGSLKVTVTIPAVDTFVPFSGVGLDATKFGTTRVENFIRYYTLGLDLTTEEVGLAWVSRSPRYLEDVSAAVQSHIGYHWVSFLVREYSMVGDDTLIADTFSPVGYSERMRVHRTAAVDVDRVHPYDTDLSEVGEPYIKRGGACE